MGASLSEQCIADWMSCLMAHKPWITAEFVTVCCSMSMVSNTSCSHFFGQWSYRGYTHAFTKLHTGVEVNFSRLWVSIYMHGLTWSELNYSAWFVLFVSSLPLSVMVCSSPSPTWQWAGHIACMKGLHEIFKYAHLKFTVYGHKHTVIIRIER